MNVGKTCSGFMARRTSSMELLASTVNGYWPLNIAINSSILNITEVQNPSLQTAEKITIKSLYCYRGSNAVLIYNVNAPFVPTINTQTM